jgi:predicted permease
MYAQIFAIVAPVMAIALLGYAWKRANQPFDIETVSAVVVNIGTPCLLISKLLGTRPALQAMADMAMVAVGMSLILGAISIVIFRAMRWPVRTYLPAMMFPNAGNMGLPLCLFAFGDEGLALAIAYFTTNAIMQFTIGDGIARGKFTTAALVKNPVAYAVTFVVAMLATDSHLPQWVMDALEVVGGLVIPLMMLSLGTSLAALTVTTLHRSFALSVLRLGGGFLLAVAITEMLGLEGAERGIAIIESTMPTAVFNYMFALRYNNQPGEVAGVVLVSTVLSFLTLPLLLAYVLAG